MLTLNCQEDRLLICLGKIPNNAAGNFSCGVGRRQRGLNQLLQWSSRTGRHDKVLGKEEKNTPKQTNKQTPTIITTNKSNPNQTNQTKGHVKDSTQFKKKISTQTKPNLLQNPSKLKPKNKTKPNKQPQKRGKTPNSKQISTKPNQPTKKENKPTNKNTLTKHNKT